jgi:hypothetical protein
VCRFHPAREVQLQTRVFAELAKQALKSTIDVVNLGNIQASVLVGNICGAEGDSVAEGLFFGKLSISIEFSIVRKVIEGTELYCTFDLAPHG